MNFLGSVFKAIKPRNDDDAIDRLNYYYTTLIIIILSLTITAKQHVGQPIQCWVPAQFTKAWEQYAENYCFVHNTYWVAKNDPIPDDVDTRANLELIYYQWVPFIMAIEAGFFHLPILFWSNMNWQTGISISSIMEMASSGDSFQEEARDKAVKIICHHFTDSVRLRKAKRQTGLFKLSKERGNYVTIVYIITKFLFLANQMMQFLMMNQFLGQFDHLWGFNILSDIVKGKDWELSGNFPRVTVCDFQVRILGNFHRYTIQCVLMLNMFNEKIFLFMYWWIIIVFVATFIDTIYWITITFRFKSRRAFIKRYLILTKPDQPVFVDFCRQLISPDGILVIRMIAQHAGELICTDIITHLWEEHQYENRFYYLKNHVRLAYRKRINQKNELEENELETVVTEKTSLLDCVKNENGVNAYRDSRLF